MSGLGHASRVAGVALLVLVGASGCQRDYRFRTTARYESPARLYRLEIEASGLVRAGHDVSQRAQAVVQFIPGPASPGRRVRVYVGLPDELTYEVEGGRAGVGSWHDMESESDTTFAELLGQWGYRLSPDEVNEIKRAIRGALAGPKGTMMEGQSRTLRVQETTIRH